MDPRCYGMGPVFQHPIGKGYGSEPVGTNRKRLGDRAGPLGQTRSNIPLSPVAYNPLRVRHKTLPADIKAGACDWLERVEPKCYNKRKLSYSILSLETPTLLVMVHTCSS